MADVTWIKLDTNLFVNRKIRLIRSQKGGDETVLVWIFLLTLAGKCNADGRIFLTADIPYTEQTLALDGGFKASVIHRALEALSGLGMISLDPLTVTDWLNHQNIDGMEKLKESKRMAQARWRAKKKLQELENAAEVIPCGKDELYPLPF